MSCVMRALDSPSLDGSTAGVTALCHEVSVIADGPGVVMTFVYGRLNIDAVILWNVSPVPVHGTFSEVRPYASYSYLKPCLKTWFSRSCCIMRLCPVRVQNKPFPSSDKRAKEQLKSFYR